MAQLDFPSPISAGATYASGGLTWQYDVTKWVPMGPTPVAFLPLSGGTLTGSLILNANPATALGAATKQYVDAGFLPFTGGTLTGNLVVPALTLTRSVFPQQAIFATGATTINWTSGEYVKITLTANATLTFSGWPATGNLAKLILDVTNNGAFTITWPVASKWAGGTKPTMTSGANSRDVYTMMTPDAGTTLLGSIVGQAYA